MRELTHDLNIRSTTWHWRWYHHWLSLGGKPASYKENLCRYVRVLLIWAPLRWIFKGNIKRLPNAAIIIGLAIGSLGYEAFYYWTFVSLLVLAGIAGLALLIGLIILAVSLYDDYPERVKKVAKYSTSPLWIVPYLVALPMRWVYYRSEKRIEAMGRWFRWRHYFGVTPLRALFISLLMGVFSYFMYLSWWKTLAAIGGVIGVIVLFVLFCFACEAINEWWKDRRRSTKPRSRIGRAFDGMTETIRLGATYVATKKRGSRICPFIEFEQSSV